MPFLTLKNTPSRSIRSASGVNEKCVGIQGEVHQGSRKSASGVKEKCIKGQGAPEKCFHGMYLAEALLANPRCTFFLPPTHFSWTSDTLLLNPWRTSPWPLAHFSLTWRAYFSEFRKEISSKKRSKILLVKTEYLKICLRLCSQKLVFNLWILSRYIYILDESIQRKKIWPWKGFFSLWAKEETWSQILQKRKKYGFLVNELKKKIDCFRNVFLNIFSVSFTTELDKSYIGGPWMAI